MSSYMLELAGLAAAMLLLVPAGTATIPGINQQQDTTNQSEVDWSDCLSCHPEYVSQLPHLSELRPAGLGTILPAACTSCHEQAELLVPPVDWNHSVRPVGAHVNCISCHAVKAHSADNPLPTPTGDYDHNGCYSCHPLVKLDFDASVNHDEHPAVRCRSCHLPHTPLQAGLTSDLLPIGARRIWISSYDWRASNELCLSCHPEGELFYFTNQGGFSTLNTVNYHELHVINGQALCIECHNPHGGSQMFFMRNTLITGEVLTYFNAMDGGTCDVSCHNVQHDYWKYTNQVF